MSADAAIPASGAARGAPRICYAIFVVVVGVLPWLPINTFAIFLAQSFCYTAIAVIGLNILLGLSGQMSLGQAGFYALGSYGSALMALKFGWPVLVAMVFGTIVAALGGLLVSIFASRTRGLYLAMATMAVGFIIEILAQRWVTLTGGAMGLPGIPQIDGVARFLWLTAACLLVVQIGADYVNDSFIGRRLRAIRESETFAASVGVSVPLWRAVTFTACAALAGLSGALFVHQVGYVGSDAFAIRLSISFLIAAVIGGLGKRSGPWLGTLILLGIVEALAGVEKYGLMIYGAILLCVLLAFPEGASGLIARAYAAFRRKPTAPATDAAPTHDHRLKLEGMPAGARLVIENVSKSYAGLKAVDGVSITVQPGTVHGLIGPNGAGKSTLINLVAGLYRCDTGRIAIDVRDVTALDTTQRAALGLARTFQNLQLIEVLTALENVMLGRAQRSGIARDFADWWRGSRFEEAARAECLEIMAFLGIGHVADRLPGELSYGHRKMVELARAIAQRSSLMLLDEPIAGLNTIEAREIAESVRRHKEAGTTIVVVEHNMEFVMSICDEISVLDHGELIMTGPSEAVRRDPRVISAYLGGGAGP